jgi:hypothetical protein
MLDLTRMSVKMLWKPILCHLMSLRTPRWLLMQATTSKKLVRITVIKSQTMFQGKYGKFFSLWI